MEFQSLLLTLEDLNDKLIRKKLRNLRDLAPFKKVNFGNFEVEKLRSPLLQTATVSCI